MFHADLSQLFPWMLAIFTVLGLIACCAWFYKCLQKCNDRCSILQPEGGLTRASPSTSRRDQDFYQVGTFRTSRPSTSVHSASPSSLGSLRDPYGYRSAFVLKNHGHPPYTHLPPPPTYDEAMAAPGHAPPYSIDLSEQLPQQTSEQDSQDQRHERE